MQKADTIKPVIFQSRLERCRKATLLYELVILFLLLFLYVIPCYSEQRSPVRLEGLQDMILGPSHSQQDALVSDGSI